MKKREIPVFVSRDRQSGEWTWEFAANYKKTQGVAQTRALASLFAAIAIRELRKQGADIQPKLRARKRLNLKRLTILQPSLSRPSLRHARSRVRSGEG